MCFEVVVVPLELDLLALEKVAVQEEQQDYASFEKLASQYSGTVH